MTARRGTSEATAAIMILALSLGLSLLAAPHVLDMAGSSKPPTTISITYAKLDLLYSDESTATYRVEAGVENTGGTVEAQICLVSPNTTELLEEGGSWATASTIGCVPVVLEHGYKVYQGVVAVDIAQFSALNVGPGTIDRLVQVVVVVDGRIVAKAVPVVYIP